MSRSPLVLLLALACAIAPERAGSVTGGEELADLEEAPGPSPRLRSSGAAEGLSKRIDTWFQGHGTRRVHVQLDRPMYRPGDTVWIKTWNVATRGLAAEGAQAAITYELVNPQGQVVETKWVPQTGATATNDFALGAEVPGGKWTLRATLPTGEVDERPFVVASYQAPRIKKDLEFVREAYGPGERVEALVELERGTGGALANHEVRALLQIAGETVLDETYETDATGAVLVGADLPAALASSDGLLTVLVEEGGVTESISRSVPIVLADLQLAFFPEGGDLVAGLPGRVYFEGTNRHGEPADVSGVVEDERGGVVAAFSSVHDGMGRVAFTPEPGRRYTARITAPEGIAASFPLPEAKDAGCTLRSFDDVKSARADVRVAVRCTTEREVTVVGALREQTLDSGAVRAGPSKDALVYLHPDPTLADRQGAVRVTVFDRGLEPLAERLVYRNPGKDLKIEVRPDRDRYGPRDEVVLDVRTTGPSGEPVPAELALAVVDDTVLRLADDEEGHMLTRLYLEPELVDSPKDPAWYFDADEAGAARGLDLVMGTKGWRRFEWKRVWAPEPEPTVTLDAEVWSSMVIETRPWDRRRVAMAMPVDMPAMAAPPMGAMAEPAEPPMAEAPPPMVMAPPMEELLLGGVRAGRAEKQAAARQAPARDVMMRDDRLQALGYIGYLDDLGYLGEDPHWGGGQQYAAVRVFPKPAYEPNFTGPRTDFRDTVLWEPTVTTDEAGRAEVRFHLSDAVTSFRVTAEGLGAGYAGHGEATLASVLPVSLATKIPVEVSAGDHLLLPVTVSNTRPGPLDVTVSSSIDSALVWASDAKSGRLTVAGDGSGTFWLPLDVGQGNASATLRLKAEGAGLSDEMEQSIRVVPQGFPRSWSASGELKDVSKHRFVVDGAASESLVATVTWHPSPVSTLITGMEGLISTPGGCFEQTSSTNWPNVAILSYLEAHDGDPRLRMKSGQALQAGYDKLTGYQVDAGGFETWGSGPGKEALSAFGLLQFSDMKRVFPVADKVLERDASYLLAQRDGKGGFRNSGESAHGYGSAPPAVLDGFITWALVATGHGDRLATEIAHQADVARTTKDPYVLALAARSLVASGHAGAKPAVERLVALQAADGSFPGAESSITRSYEANLVVESTALAALALMESGAYFHESDHAAAWLVANRQGAGTWGATQATALALSALTEHADRSRRPRGSGTLRVEVNGRDAGSVRYDADQTEPIRLAGLEAFLVSGENEIVLRHDGKEPLPFTVDVGWSAITPASAPGAELALDTTLDRERVAMGETVRLTAKIDNRTDRVVPSPIARVRLPAGLEAQTWQLKQLQERGVIAFFETRPREVTLYWDGLHANAAHTVALDLVASVPGVFTGPASSAYPYYDDDEKAWDAGLRVEIARP